MKSSSKKPAAKKRKPAKKRKKKPVFRDGVRAALIAAVLIGVTVLVTISLIVANSAINNSSGPPADQTAREMPPDPEKGIPGIKEPENTGNPSPENKPPAQAVPVNPAPARDSPGKTPETPVRAPVSPEVPKTAPVNPPEDGKKVVRQVPSAGVPEVPPKPAPEKKGTLVFVMDDAGNNLHELAPFLTFSGPLTIAVLPGLPHSAEAARRIRASGKEVILHQPMEAIGGQNPGPGAIYTGMTPDEIRAVLEKNLREVGPVVGMNNHQGSKVTMDEKAMEIILSVCHDKGIYFLDSRTTADTVVPAVATRRGIKIWERDVFLDNIQEKAAMIRSIHDGLQKAEKKGGAVMIGHVWSSELAATLEELYPDMVEQGFSLSTISKVMMGTLNNEDFGD